MEHDLHGLGWTRNELVQRPSWGSRNYIVYDSRPEGEHSDQHCGLNERFISLGEDDFAEKVLSALRDEFGGHEEKTAAKKEGF